MSQKDSAAPVERWSPTAIARALERTIVVIEPILRTVASAGVLVLMTATVVDVVSRTLTGRGLPGVIEITEIVLVATVFFGMMTSGRDGQHIRVTLLTDRLPEAAARIVRTLGLISALVIVGWLTWVTIEKAIVSVQTAEYRFGLISVPIWPARVAIPIGLVCLALVLIFLLVAQVSKYASVVGREREPFEDLLDSPIAEELS
ncbi:TRAP transporter small permease [Microbacterium sp. A94]|uniref:TRAP transporter small permease n=1 Tax=Microbacterium sp. A94 TaxID=3450717 RepID=UPI003F433D83